MARQPYRQTTHRKDPVKQYKGAISKAQGKHFEEYIELALRYYEQKGEAAIEKTPEPMRPTRDLGNGKFIAYYEKHAQADYKGTLKGGQTVLFDAKYTADTRIDQSRVTREQAEQLDKYQRMGADCFIIAGLGHGECYRVPWAVWKDMKNVFGHKHATAEELEPYRLSVGRNGVLLLLG